MINFEPCTDSSPRRRVEPFESPNSTPGRAHQSH